MFFWFPTQPNTPHTCCELSILQSSCDVSIVPTNLSISSSCNKSVKLVIHRLVATFHLQTCYNLLKQLAASLWITSFGNQLATILLTTCYRLVVNKLSQAMRTHPDIGCKMSTDLLQLPRFWLRTCKRFLPKIFPGSKDGSTNFFSYYVSCPYFDTCEVKMVYCMSL